MGDRSWVNLSMATHPVPDQVVELLGEFGVVGDARAEPADVADLHIPEARIGTAEMLADKIVAVWPEAGFTVTQEPMYEYAGIQLRYGPDTGMCAHHVDGEGDPYLYTEELRGLLEAHRNSPEHLVSVLHDIVEQHLGPRPAEGRGR